MAEKHEADEDKRDMNMKTATANFNMQPFEWEACAARTRCFVVFSVDNAIFAASSYIKSLVHYCSNSEEESQ